MHAVKNRFDKHAKLGSKIAKFATLSFAFFILTLANIKAVAYLSYLLMILLGVIAFFSMRKQLFRHLSVRLFVAIGLLYALYFFLTTMVAPYEYAKPGDAVRLLYFFFLPFLLAALYFVKYSAKEFFFLVRLGALFSFLAALIDIYIFSNGYGRLTIMNPNVFADIVTILGVVTLASMNMRDQRAFVVDVSVLVSVLVALFLSGSRGSLLVFTLVLIVSIAIKIARCKACRKKLLMLLSVIAAIFAILWVTNERIRYKTERFIDQLQNIDKSVVDASTTYRIDMYKGALTAFTQAPIFGYGFNGANEAVADIALGNPENMIAHFSHLHNDFLTHLVNGGMVGAFLYLGLFSIPFFFFYRGYKHSFDDEARSLSLVGMVFLVCYLLLSLFHGMLGLESESALFVVMVGYLLIRVSDKEYSSKIDPKKQSQSKNRLKR